MKIRLSVSMLLLAAGALPASAGAAAYGSIQLCEGVTLADDHVSGWGCWNSIEPTAAGPGTGGGTFMALPSGSDYRQNPAFSQQAFECPAGARCGHAMYLPTDDVEALDEGASITEQAYPAHAVANVNPTGETVEGRTPIEASFRLVPIGTAPAPTFTDSGRLEGYAGTSSGSARSETSRIVGKLVDDSSPLILGYFWVIDYINGNPTNRGTLGAYVTGTERPSTNALSTLALNNPIANYSGYEAFSGKEVSIRIEFNNTAWSGTWGRGSATEWNAIGRIDGGNIQSTSIGGIQGQTSYYNAGQVNGSFYGPNAEALAGVAGVQRIVNSEVTARHTDLFLTNRVSAPE